MIAAMTVATMTTMTSFLCEVKVIGQTKHHNTDRIKKSEVIDKMCVVGLATDYEVALELFYTLKRGCILGHGFPFP